MSMNKNTIIFDLDGTLADIDERKQKAQWKSNDKAMDWDIFFDPENIKLDKPKPEVIKCAQMFHQQAWLESLLAALETMVLNEKCLTRSSAQEGVEHCIF